MNKYILATFALLASIWTGDAAAQSSPNFQNGQVLTAGQLNAAYAGKTDYNPMGLPIAAGGTGATTLIGAQTNLGITPGPGGAQPYSATLTSLAAITGSNNAVPYFTAASAMAAAVMSGDCTFAAGVVTCTKTNGVNFGVFATDTATQATAALNLFTSLLQGVAPASGGGTTNFLRADGSWAAPAATYVTSVFTRTGAVTATSGDYTVSQVTGAAPLASPTFTGHITTEGVTATGATGTGNFVYSSGPTLVAPHLGTPADGVATNLTGTASGLTAGSATTAGNVTGTVLPTHGGTGLTSLTAHGVLIGAGTSNVAPTGTGTTGQILTSNGASADPTFQSGVLIYNYKNGFLLKNDGGTPNTVLDVAVGQAADTTNTVMMTLSTAGTINMASAGAGGLDTGSFAPNTWYAALVIEGASGTTVMATKETAGSAISPTMPSGYTVYRYIGSFLSDGSTHILLFTQFGNTFLWPGGVQEVNNTGYATATLVTLTVPKSVQVTPLMGFEWNNAINSQVHAWSPLLGSGASDQSNVVVQESAAVGTAGYGLTNNNLITDISGRIYINCGTSSASLFIAHTAGWIDNNLSNFR